MTERQTRAQQKLLEFIREFIDQHGYGPSYREIMTGLGYKSVSTVAVHVDGVIAKGYLQKKGRSARSLELVSSDERARETEYEAWLRDKLASKTAEERRIVLDIMGYEKKED